MPNNDERVEPFENDKQVNDSAKKGKKVKKHSILTRNSNLIKVATIELKK